MLTLANLTVYGQPSVSNNRTPSDTCKPRTVSCDGQKKILHRIASGDECCKQAKRLQADSSTLQQQKASQARIIEEKTQQVVIAEGVIVSQNKQVAKITDENKKLERKLKRQKALKWVFGGIGLAAGIVIPFLL